MSSSAHTYGASLRDLFSNPNGDTLIYLENPLLPGRLQTPLRASSSALNSTEFKRHLGPTNQYRLLRRKKLLQNGLPMGVRFVMDLSPPQEGDEAVEVMEKLWCPDYVRQWKREDANAGVYEEPDNGYAQAELEIPQQLDEFYNYNWGEGWEELKQKPSTTPAVLRGMIDQFDPDDNCVTPSSPGLGPSTGSPEAEMDAVPCNEKSVKISEEIETVPFRQKSAKWSEPPAYSVERHIAAVERLIGILNGVEPHIHSATMWYTLYRVAVMLKCTPMIVDYVVRWIYDGNQAFVELFTPLVMEIAEEIQAECLFRECFALMVARELVCDGVNNGFYSVAKGGSTEKWKRAIYAATYSLGRRIPDRWAEVFNFKWLDDPKIVPSMAVLNEVLQSPSKYSISFIEQTSILKTSIEEVLMKPLIKIAQGKGGPPLAPPAPPPSVTLDIWDQWRADVFQTCGEEDVRLYNRYAWMQIRDINWKIRDISWDSIDFILKDEMNDWRLHSRKSRLGEWKPPQQLINMHKREGSDGSPGRKRTAEMSDDGCAQAEHRPAQKRTVLLLGDQNPSSPTIKQEITSPWGFDQDENDLSVYYGMDTEAIPDYKPPMSPRTRAIQKALENASISDQPLLQDAVEFDVAPPVHEEIFVLDFESYSEEDEDGITMPEFSPAGTPTQPLAPNKQEPADPTPIKQEPADDSSTTVPFPPTCKPPRPIYHLRDIKPSDITLLTSSADPAGHAPATDPDYAFRTNPSLDITINPPHQTPTDPETPWPLLEPYSTRTHPTFPFTLTPAGTRPVMVHWHDPPAAARFSVTAVLREAKAHLRRLALPVCANSLGWEFMNFQLLTCLDAAEWAYLPIWAGGLDDGSGAVFGDPPATGTETGTGTVDGKEMATGMAMEEDGDDGYSLVGSETSGEMVEAGDGSVGTGMVEVGDAMSVSTMAWSEAARSERSEASSCTLMEWEEAGASEDGDEGGWEVEM
ncbi:hypothetical protein EDC01DRAFT_424103 [Geopyxis carbonaria]|nr:hypothetical protein EDC01DRAFT_424103 [Geopyxis carbonaria]